jgi:hypothetical protein
LKNESKLEKFVDTLQNFLYQNFNLRENWRRGLNACSMNRNISIKNEGKIQPFCKTL